MFAEQREGEGSLEVDFSHDKSGTFIGPRISSRPYIFHSQNELRLHAVLATIAKAINSFTNNTVDRDEFRISLNSVLRPFGYEVNPIEVSQQSHIISQLE